MEQSTNTKIFKKQFYWRKCQKYMKPGILRSRYDARTPPLEAHSPGHRSNVENARRWRPVTGQPATPTCDIRRAMLRTPPSPAGH